MTKEEKELLLKDLSGRLPYHTNLYSEYADDNWAILTPAVYAHTANCSPDEIRIKPYLFPLSSMTEEQRTSHNFLKYSAYANPIKLVDWYNRNHFDYRGLIPMGLAIDATNKNIY